MHRTTLSTSGRLQLRRLGVLTAVLASAGLVAGCGGGGDSTTATSSGGGTTATTTTTASTSGALKDVSADDTLAKAKAAASAAKSVHVKGSGTSDGSTIKLDMKLVAGTGGSGTIGLGGSTIDVIVAGTDVYIKADDTFYKQQLGSAYTDAIGKAISGKYLKGSSTDQRLANFVNFGDMKAFFDGILEPEGETLKKAAGKDFNGIPTVALDSGNGGKLYVADDGTDLPVAIEPGGSGDSGSIGFTEWNTIDASAVAAPPADQVLDITALGG